MDYDAELRLHTEVLRRAYGIGPHDHVLDIGCGAGETTRDAARLAVAGSVVGVDVSAPMIERARQLAEAAGLHNVTFEQADAELHHFPVEWFQVAISRFGTMFFADPVAAFTNIGRAMRPGGRLAMMVWQDHLRNEWSVSIQRALTGADVPAAVPGRRNRSRSAILPPPSRSSSRPASVRWRSPTCTSPCTMVRMSPPRSNGSAGSGVSPTCSAGWITTRMSAPSRG